MVSTKTLTTLFFDSQHATKKIIIEIMPTIGGSTKLNNAPSSAPCISAVMERIQHTIVKITIANIPKLLTVIFVFQPAM